jgi:hypothetical protein
MKEKICAIISIVQPLPNILYLWLSETQSIYIDLGFKRKLTPTECEKLQTVPLNYSCIF